MPRLTRVLTVVAAVLAAASGASLAAVENDVPLEVGEPLHLDCGIQGHHRHCLWEAQDGRVLQVEDVHAGRHAGLRAPNNLTHNQCGIVVEQARAGDAGAWTCTVFTQGKALTTIRNVVTKDTRECRPSFHIVGSGCFYFSDTFSMTWSDARDFCHTLGEGVDLAVVDDCYLMQLVWNHISSNYGERSHWLGGTDEHQEGMWVWVDGTAIIMGTPFWRVTEPNNLNETEHCLHMNSVHKGYFNDLDCRTEMAFMCQDFLYA